MIYLNNASTTFPKPESVMSAIESNIRTAPFNYGRSGTGRGEKNIVNDTRQLIKAFFNAGENYHCVFTSGSTEALNLAIKGLNLNGCNVVITASEHNSVIRPLKYLEGLGIISITVVPCDKTGFVQPEKIFEYITDNTKLVCVNHCSNVTGTLQDISSITELAHKKDCLVLIDGSQSAGCTDIDLDKIDADIFCFTGHKSLYGLQGTGGIIFRKSIPLTPLKQGGTGTNSLMIVQPDEFPTKYESGTMNIPGICSLEAGIKWVMETSLDNIIKRKKEMINYVHFELSKFEDITFYYNAEKSSGSLLSFNISDIEPEEINYILSNSFDISIRSGIHCAALIHSYLGTRKAGTLRISPSYFTTYEEIDKFIQAMKKIVKSL
jgi:cysteine desulfurase family protein